MRRFDVRKQQEGETLAVFEQILLILHRETWPKTDLNSPEADSLLRRKFIDGILDVELRKYLRLHAASDDFAATVSKARHFVDASKLSRAHKKLAIRTTSPSVNYQTIVDGVMEALVLHDQGRTAEVHVLQVPTSTASTGSRNKKNPSRQGLPATSDASSGSSRRASPAGRTVRFQDPGDDKSARQSYGPSSRNRWQGNQSPQQGNNNGPR